MKNKFLMKSLSVSTVMAMALLILTGISFGGIPVGVAASAETGEAFVVTGGTSGTDYTYESGVLTILSDKALTISNSDASTATTDRIEIAKGVSANITLAGVNIDVSGVSNAAAIKIANNSAGEVIVTLADGTTNTLKSGYNCAGIQKNGNYGKLTIAGTGELKAIGGDNSAGIGGGYYSSANNIEISGGTVTAQSGSSGAGIGGGYNGSGNSLTISGGEVTATGSSYAAGIGGGEKGSANSITISGGTVYATSGQYAAGIGGGSEGSGSNIVISGGEVTATGGQYAAGIGGGSDGSANSITISGGTVYATGGQYAAGIGGGDGTDNGGDGTNIKISGGTVTATGGAYGAGLGGGYRGDGTNIIISGGSVKAVAGARANGIGGGYYGGGAVTPTLEDGTTLLYLLELSTDGTSDVIINGVTYPKKHFSEKKLYVYLPAKTAETPNEVTIGSTTVKYTYNTTNLKWVKVVDAPKSDDIVFTYNGEEQIYALTNSDCYTISDNITQTNAGVYTITVALNDKENTVWNNGMTDDLTYLFTINKADITITWNNQTLASTGEEAAIATPTIAFIGTDNPEVELTYSYKAQGDTEYTVGLPTVCGTYDVKVHLAETDNYRAGECTMTLTITCTDADDNGICDYCGFYEVPELVDEYYQIANAGHLMWFAKEVNAGETAIKARLTADIDMNDINWTVMSSFAGVFDGNEYTILDLCADESGGDDDVADGSRCGLFQTLSEGGMVTNLTMAGAQLWSANSAGAIAAVNNGIISKCIVKDSTIQLGASHGLAAIAGTNTGMVTDCGVVNCFLQRRWSAANNSTYAIGAVVENNSGDVINCFSYGCTFSNSTNLYAIVESGNTPVNCYYYTAATVSDAVATAKTADQFASGEVAYLLNGEKTDGTQSWYQTLKTDTYPVPDNSHGTVYSISACDGETPAGYSNENKNEPHIDENGDDYCDDCGVIYNGIGAHLAGYSVSLNGSISVNFHMDVTQAVLDDSEAYMLFTLKNGATQKVMVSEAKAKESALVDGKIYYVFTCNVAAKEMTDTIQAQLITSDGSKTQVYEYSVREYADRILSGNYDAETQELVKAMLHYGAYSQEWFDYNTTNLANEELDILDLSEADDWDLFNPSISNNDKVGSFTSAYLTLESDTAINLKFKLADGVSFEDLRFVVEDPLGNVVPVTTVTTENVCLITLTGIKASDLDTTYSFCVTDEEGNESSILYSAMSYACAVADSEMDQKLKDVTAALRIFNLRANDLFE